MKSGMVNQRAPGVGAPSNILAAYRLIFKHFLTILRADKSFGHARFFLMRSILQPTLAARWIEYIKGYSARLGLKSIPWHMSEKPLRTYGCLAWSDIQRNQYRIDHYDIFRAISSPDKRRQLFSGQSVELAEIVGRKSIYRLLLRDSLYSRKEGELEVVLYSDKTELALARLTFIFCNHPEHGRIIVIGGAQGLHAGYDKRFIVDATRDMYGVRPKQAVLEVVQYLAGLTACKKILAVANNTHVWGSKSEAYRAAKIKADYDSFWIERGGMADNEVGFILPIKHFDALPDASNGNAHFPSGKERVKFNCYCAANSIFDNQPRRPSPTIAKDALLVPA